jgi:hypothetical protein
MIYSCYASAIQTTSSPLYWTLSTMRFASSSIRVMYGSFVSYFLLFHASFSFAGFLTVCEGCAPFVVPWVVSSPACEVFFLIVCG